MAAFSSFHIFASGALSRRASVDSTPRVKQYRTSTLAEVAVRARAAAGEIVAFLWTVLALAFSLLVMAGFFL
jgi:hypothetical protein